MSKDFSPTLPGCPYTRAPIESLKIPNKNHIFHESCGLLKIYRHMWRRLARRRVEKWWKLSVCIDDGTENWRERKLLVVVV